MKCLECKNGELFLYRELCIAEYRKITSRKTISKRLEMSMDKTYGMPEYLECDSCGCIFDFDVDEKDKINEVWKRDNF